MQKEEKSPSSIAYVQEDNESSVFVGDMYVCMYVEELGLGGCWGGGRGGLRGGGLADRAAAVVAFAAEAADAVFFGGSGGVALGCEIEFLAECVQALTDTLDD